MNNYEGVCTNDCYNGEPCNGWHYKCLDFGSSSVWFKKNDLKHKNNKMSRNHHYLKTETEYYQAVEQGLKRFELRKNDRDFQVYDMIYLEETVKGEYTGRKLQPLQIRYILHGGKYGLEDGYCIVCW